MFQNPKKNQENLVPITEKIDFTLLCISNWKSTSLSDWNLLQCEAFFYWKNCAAAFTRYSVSFTPAVS